MAPRPAPRRSVQRLFIEDARGFDGTLHACLALSLLALLAALPRHLEARLPRQLLHRLGEAQIAGLHGEADDIAMRATAEAVIKTLVLNHAEGRRLLVVEGA